MAATITIEVPGGKGMITAEAKEFSTGSKGFYGNGKVVGADGAKYQVSVNIVLIGSKKAAA